MERIQALALILALASVFSALSPAVSYGQTVASPAVARHSSLIPGADVSWTPQDEAAGAQYYDHGVPKDIFDILKEHGFNHSRPRIFVDFKTPGGCASKELEAFCGLEHTKAMAKRAKAAGMEVAA